MQPNHKRDTKRQYLLVFFDLFYADAKKNRAEKGLQISQVIPRTKRVKLLENPGNAQETKQRFVR